MNNMGKILVTQNSLFKNQWGSLLKQLNVKNNTSAWNTLVSALRQYSPLTGTWDIQNGKIHPVAYLYVEHPGITSVFEKRQHCATVFGGRLFIFSSLQMQPGCLRKYRNQ